MCIRDRLSAVGGRCGPNAARTRLCRARTARKTMTWCWPWNRDSTRCNEIPEAGESTDDDHVCRAPPRRDPEVPLVNNAPLMKGELHAYVARQAIFDRRLDVVGYELLYRDSEENRARFDDVTQASAQTMLNAFVEIGLDNLVGKVPAYVNMAADFLLGSYPIPLPPERTVIEVLENIPVTPALVEALQGLRAQGYKIALDDFILTEESRPLLSVAHIIKVSML